MEWPIKNNLAYLLFMLCPLVGVLVYFGRYVTLILDVSRNLLHHCRAFDGRIAIVGCNLLLCGLLETSTSSCCVGQSQTDALTSRCARRAAVRHG